MEIRSLGATGAVTGSRFLLTSGRIRHRPVEVLLVHGEPTASEAPRLRVEEDPGRPARIPEHLETVPLQ
ncbi:MAG: hypothetical protein ACQEXJ_06835 [Myxococcota bacterium]